MAERRGEQLVVAVHGDAIELLISRHDTSQACLSNGGFERECEDLCELARANGLASVHHTGSQQPRTWCRRECTSGIPPYGVSLRTAGAVFRPPSGMPYAQKCLPVAATRSVSESPSLPCIAPT